MRENQRNKPTYAIIGLGFVADKHLQAINNVGGEVILGCDIDESKKHKIGEAKFYKDWHAMMLDPLMKEVDFVSICTPNYLHYEMAYSAVIKDKKVILEKPAVISMEDFNRLVYYKDKIFPVHQLRYNEGLIEKRNNINSNDIYQAKFAVCVHRDDWYFDSWKNKKEESGGLMFNIGVHYFDLLCWFFGKPLSWNLTENQIKRASGIINFENCSAGWELSIDQPHDNQYRYLEINGEKINLSQGFENLHTKIYQEALNGKGVDLKELEPVIKLLKYYD